MVASPTPRRVIYAKAGQEKDEWYRADHCAHCRRSDVMPLTMVYKSMFDTTASDAGGTCYMEVYVPTLCILCRY